jgi:hypothetical protein
MFKYTKRKLTQFKRWMDYNPPGSMSSKGWRLFGKEFKEKAPIRHWFKHEFRHAITLPIKWKYDKINYWIRYRTYDRYHIVDTGLKPDYYDVRTLVLHANFNMLKDFVEVEQAWHTYLWSDEYKNKASWCEKHMPFYRFFYPFRRPDLGIKHLEWASTLDDPKLPPHERCDHQAVAAREISAIYDWWVNQRPARKEIEHTPYDNQGLDGILACFDDDFDRTAPDFIAHQKSMDDAGKQEEEWHDEDEQMLIRLIKVRRSLWT